jgi:flagellar motor component MotA
MTNEKTTINDLARMIKKGFDENTEQHQQMFKRLKKIDIKIRRCSLSQRI